MILDANLVFSSTSTPQAVSGAAGDVYSTNSIDLAPHLALNAPYAADSAQGTEHMDLIVTLPTGHATTTTGTFQVVLQSSTFSTFDTAEKPIEFPITMPMGQSVIVGSIAAVTGILTVGTLTSGGVQLGALVTGGTTPAGTFITGQLTGTPGGVGTYSTNCVVAVAAPTGTTTAYAGRTFVFRLPANGLRRYIRLAYRTAAQTSTAVTASSYLLIDAQNAPIQGASGFFVG